MIVIGEKDRVGPNNLRGVVFHRTSDSGIEDFEAYYNKCINDAIISAAQPGNTSVMFTNSFNEEDFNHFVDIMSKPEYTAVQQEPIWVMSGWNNRPLKIRFEGEPIKHDFSEFSEGYCGTRYSTRWYDSFDSVVLTPEEFETKYMSAHPEDDCEECADEFPEFDEYIQSLMEDE